jgi:hypothetical protein
MFTFPNRLNGFNALVPMPASPPENSIFRETLPEYILGAVVREHWFMNSEAAQVSSLAPPLGDISREEILRRLDDPKLTIMDALPPESYEAAHIPGAINLPVADVEQSARTLLPDPAAEIAVYCAKFT